MEVDITCNLGDDFFFNKRIKNITFSVILFFIIWAMYEFNRHTPLVADDMILAMFVREHNLYEILEAFYNYYMYWGGRVVVHFIALCFLSVDKSIFNVANTLVYVIFNFLILFHGLGKNLYSPIALIFVNLMIFLYTPAFGQDFLWLDGAANYLWGVVIILAFFVPYRLQMTSNDNIFKNERLLLLLIFLAGIIAGWTNENMTLALISMVFVCIYLNKKIYNRIFKWQILGGIGALIGSTLLLLAPGNFNRLAQEGGGQQVDIVKNFFDITVLFTDSHFLLYPLLLMIAFFILSLKKSSLNNLIYIPYLTGFFVSMYAMLGSPYYTDRAKLGSLVLILILIVYFYGILEFSDTLKKCFIIIGFAMMFLLYNEWNIANVDIKDYDRREKVRIEQIMNERGVIDEIIVEDNEPLSRYVAAYGLEKLSTDKNYVLNKTYADFYGAKFIRIK